MEESADRKGSAPKGQSISKGMGIAALILGGGVFLSKCAGFFRDMIIAALHGATSATDAYFAAFTLPDLLNYMLAGGALSISFIPIFARHLAQDDEKGGWHCFSTTITIMTLAMVLLTVVGFILAPHAVPFLVPGFSSESIDAAVRMTRIILPAQIFFIAGGILSATLYARKQFVAPALAPLVYNLFIILGGVVLGPFLGIYGFAWGVLVGAIMGPFGVPLLAARRSISYRPSLMFRDPGFLAFLRMAIPLMLGFSLLTVDEWLARYFASGTAGVISHLNNARRLMLVPTGVLAFAAGTAALPFLSQLHAQNKLAEMGKALGQALRAVAQISIVASGGLAAVALPAVTLVFGRGRFTTADILSTAQLLVLFSVGIGAWGVQGVAARGFYAMRDTLTPMLVGSAVALASVGLYALLWSSWGPPGLPVATAIGMTTTAVVTLVWLWRKKVEYAPKLLALTTLRSLILAGAGFGACHLLTKALSISLDPLQHLHALLMISAQGTLYMSIVLLFAKRAGLPEVSALPARFLKRLGGRILRRPSVATPK